MIVKTLPKVRCELYHKRLLLQVTMGKGAKIKLEDKDSDVLFKEVPIETYPGLAIQSVTDSSRWSCVTWVSVMIDDWIIFADISS